MDPLKQPTITGQYVVTSMSIGSDGDDSFPDTCIFTTMSIEYTSEPADISRPDAGATVR